MEVNPKQVILDVLNYSKNKVKLLLDNFRILAVSFFESHLFLLLICLSNG